MPSKKYTTQQNLLVMRYMYNVKSNTQIFFQTRHAFKKVYNTRKFVGDEIYAQCFSPPVQTYGNVLVIYDNKKNGKFLTSIYRSFRHIQLFDL